MNCEPQLSETYHPSTHFVRLIIVEIDLPHYDILKRHAIMQL